MFKVNKSATRCTDVFIVNFEHHWHHFIVFLLLNLAKERLAGKHSLNIFVMSYCLYMKRLTICIGSVQFVLVWYKHLTHVTSTIAFFTWFMEFLCTWWHQYCLWFLASDVRLSWEGLLFVVHDMKRTASSTKII